MSTATETATVPMAPSEPASRRPRWANGLAEWAVAIGVGVAVAAMMAIPFLQNHTFYYGGDNPESFVPLWHHFGLQLRAGHWPTMDPAGWYGGNYAAEGTYALWNPVLLVDYLVVSLFDDLAAAAAVVQIQFLALLGIGAYRLCREYGAGRVAAVVVAVGVPATGFTLFYEATGWPAGLGAFTWVAWFWWAARRQARGRLWPLVTFVVGALGITTGNPYAALGIIVVLLGIAVELLVRRDFRRLAGLIVTGLCVGATAALVFLPLVGTLPVTNRQQIAGVVNDTFLVPHLSDVAASSAPTYLPAILNWNGAVLERLPSTYFLWFAAPILPWLRWRGGRRPGRPLTSLFVVTVIFGALTFGPSNLWLFRWPIRLIEYFYLGLAVLLALALSRGPARDHVGRRALATVAIVATGGYLSWAVRPDIWAMHAEATVGVLVLMAAAVAAFRWRGALAAGAVLVAGTVLVVTYQTGRLPLGATGGPVPDVAGTPISVAQVERATAEYRGAVLQLGVESSVGSARRAQTGELLFGNESLMSGHESVVRYSGMSFQKFFEALCMDYRGQVCPEAFDRAWRAVGDTGRPLVDLLGVRTLVIDAHLFPGPAAAPPPAGWSVAARDSLRTVWVRDQPSAYAGRLTWASPGIEVASDAGSSRTESVSFDAGTPGRLIFARLAWPGYTATLDGAPVEVQDGPAGLVTVDVPAGRHVLALGFESPGVPLGLRLLVAAALVSFLQTVLWVAVSWRRRRRAAVPAPDGPGHDGDRAVPADDGDRADATPLPAGDGAAPTQDGGRPLPAGDEPSGDTAPAGARER